MEIHDNNIRESFLRRIIKRIGAKRIITNLLLAIIFLGFGFGCIVYGAYLNKTSQTSVLKMFLIRMSEFDLSFIPNYAESKTADIENLDIDINFKNLEKIRYLREKALYYGRITDETQEEIPASIRYNNDTYRVDLSLTGMTSEHIRHPSKWSLAVKVKDGKTIMGMKKFALLFTQSRGYLTDWIATKLLQSKGVVGLRIDFVNVQINGKSNGIYYLEERFDKRLIENNEKREGIIFKADGYGSDIRVYGMKTIQGSEELSAQLARLKKLWHLFLNGEIEAEKLLDLDKFASIFVVSDLLNQKHAVFFMNMRLYFNPITGLIEPIGREWGYLRAADYTQTTLSIDKPVTHSQIAIRDNEILEKIINSSAFEEKYIKQAKELSNTQYLDSIIEQNRDELTSLLHKIHQQNPFYKFPLDLLHKNQHYIWEKLHPSLPTIKVSYEAIANDSIYLNIENVADLPVEIHSLNYNNRINIIPGERILLASNFKSINPVQTLGFPLEQIDVSMFSTDSLIVNYGFLGLDHIKGAIVFPDEKTSLSPTILFPTRQSPNINKFQFLDIDEENKRIIFTRTDCIINEDLIIPEGYIVSAEPGCKIDLLNSSRIISYSPFRFFGQKDTLITITSSDSTGQGLVVFNCDQISEMSYVYFSYLSSISSSGWDLRGAITYYNSPVNFNHCIFNSNLNGDDYLNILKTDFNIMNTTFENTVADAFDADFCTGTIKNVRFLQVGNDAIDVSGTEMNIIDIEIVDAGDKGVSGGEKSHLKCQNVIITGGEIAVACKDNSQIDIDKINIHSSKLAYCAFQKKPEFGPGVIIVTNAKIENVETDYLVEVGSTVSVNGFMVEEKSNKVKEMLYGADYGKSSR